MEYGSDRVPILIVALVTISRGLLRGPEKWEIVGKN